MAEDTTNEKPLESLNILQKGVAMPYLAIFDKDENPIMADSNVGSVPLGALVSKFEFKSTIKSKDTNLLTLTLQTGDYNVIDLDTLSEGTHIWLQWGYIYSNGQSLSSPPRCVAIRDVDATFNSQGVTLMIKCVDSSIALNHTPPFIQQEESGDKGIKTLVDYMNEGAENKIGIIIKRYNNG
jgi:hypothetical protein